MLRTQCCLVAAAIALVAPAMAASQPSPAQAFINDLNKIEEDALYRICPAYAFPGHCLHVSSQWTAGGNGNDVRVYAEPDPIQQIGLGAKTWDKSTWRLEQVGEEYKIVSASEQWKGQALFLPEQWFHINHEWETELPTPHVGSGQWLPLWDPTGDPQDFGWIISPSGWVSDDRGSRRTWRIQKQRGGNGLSHGYLRVAVTGRDIPQRVEPVPPPVKGGYRLDLDYRTHWIIEKIERPAPPANAIPGSDPARVFRICPFNKHEGNCLATDVSNTIKLSPSQAAGYSNHPETLWHVYRDFRDHSGREHFVFESSLRRHAQESESADCAPGYVQSTGLMQDVHGLTAIKGRGGGEIVDSCDACGALCDAIYTCQAYECSPDRPEKECWLSTVWEPNSPKTTDFNFCSKRRSNQDSRWGHLLHIDAAYNAHLSTHYYFPTEGMRWHLTPVNVAGRTLFLIQPSQRHTDRYLWVSQNDLTPRISTEPSYWTIEEVFLD